MLAENCSLSSLRPFDNPNVWHNHLISQYSDFYFGPIQTIEIFDSSAFLKILWNNVFWLHDFNEIPKWYHRGFRAGFRPISYEAIPYHTRFDARVAD